jgi:hypothetical protein
VNITISAKLLPDSAQSIYDRLLVGTSIKGTRKLQGRSIHIHREIYISMQA